MRVFSQDARRVGLLTVRRRRLTAREVHPVGAVQHAFEWFSGDGAVAPTTGERVFLELPYVHAPTFHLLVDAFAAALPDSVTILLVDHRGAHTAPQRRWPEHGRCVWLPPDGPELNPIERVWRDRKDDLAWLPFIDLAGHQVDDGDRWQSDDAPPLQALTGDPYVVEAITALGA